MKKSSVLIILLVCISLSLGGFIIYDKVIKREEVNKECEKCQECEKKDLSYLNNNVEPNIPVECTIDMKGLAAVDISDFCEYNYGFESHQIRVTNLEYNGVPYTFTYVLVRDKSIQANNINLSDNAGFVKIYIGDRLIDAHYGLYRNHLSNVRVDGSILNITEIYPSDVPGAQSSFDISKIID